MSIIHLYSPACCAICSRETSSLPICPECNASWRSRRLAGGCPVCFQPVPDAGCAFCDSRHVFFDSLRALFPMDEMGRELIHRWKFENERELFRVFVAPVIEELKHLSVDRIGTISPGRGRRLSRAYEPLEDLARAVSRHTGIPTSADVCKRRRGKQSAARYEERFFHMAGSLSLTGSFSSANTYLLLEDVFTTGATANESARLLKRAGVVAVHVLALFQRQRDGIEWTPSHEPEKEMSIS